jgi:hypothetical protein
VSESRIDIHIEYREVGPGLSIVDVILEGPVATAASATHVLGKLIPPAPVLTLPDYLPNPDPDPETGR